MIMFCFPIVVVEFNDELMPVGYDIGVVGLMVSVIVSIVAK
jgi:hypothetical protein